jgi:hypothetical protein
MPLVETIDQVISILVIFLFGFIVAQKFPTIGFKIIQGRVDELNAGYNGIMG